MIQFALHLDTLTSSGPCLQARLPVHEDQDPLGIEGMNEAAQGVCAVARGADQMPVLQARGHGWHHAFAAPASHAALLLCTAKDEREMLEFAELQDKARDAWIKMRICPSGWPPEPHTKLTWFSC